MSYAKGVIGGHATGDLTYVIVEALDNLQTGKIKEWYDDFSSLKEARIAAGRLWHCTDVVGYTMGVIVQDVFRLENRPNTMAQISRVLLADLKAVDLVKGGTK